MNNELVLLRRKHALTQTELAYLVGVSQTFVGRLEQNGIDKLPHLRLETAFGLQIVFGKRPSDLYVQFFHSVEDAVMGRAAALDRRLDGLLDRATEHKRALLMDMVRRAANDLKGL